MLTHGTARDDAHGIHSDQTTRTAQAEDLASKAARQAAELYADEEHQMRKRRFERAIALAADDS